MEQLTGAIGVTFYLFLGYVFIASQIEFFGEHLTRYKAAGKEKYGRRIVMLGGLSIILPLILGARFAPMLTYLQHYTHPTDKFAYEVLTSVLLLNITTSCLAGMWYFVRRRGWRRPSTNP